MALRRVGSLLLPQLESALTQQASSSGRLSHALGGFSSAATESIASTSDANNCSLPWRKEARKRISVPLTQALPGITPELPFRPSAQPPPTEVTVLDNGVRIVTEASPVSWLHLEAFGNGSPQITVVDSTSPSSSK